MEVKKEEEDFPISGDVSPFDGPVEFKLEDDDFPVHREIKEELVDQPCSSVSHLMKDSLMACGKNEFGSNESMEGEESRGKMEEEDPEIIEVPEEDRPARPAELPRRSVPGNPIRKLDSKRVRVIRDAITTATEVCTYYKGERKKRLQAAIYAAYIQDMTPTAAGLHYNVSRMTINEYVKRVKKKLSYILPSQNLTVTGIDGNAIMEIPEEGLPSDKGTLDSKRIQTIRDVISKTVKRCLYLRERKDRLEAAIYAVYIGEQTVKDALDEFDLPSTTFQQYLHETRRSLGAILPPQDLLPMIPNMSQPTGKNAVMPIGEDETVTIDGIVVPNSINTLTEWLISGRIDCSEAQPFQGTNIELRAKLVAIIQSLSFGGVLMKLVDGIMCVYVDGKAIHAASRIHKLNQKVLSDYAGAVRVFIDFSKSPCAWEYRSRSDSMVSQAFPLDSASKDLCPQPLPIPAEERSIDEWEVKKEEVDDDYGPIEPPVKKIKEE